MNPRKMKQMMNQMGIDLDDIDAEEVIIRTPEEELVFHDADVQRMDAQGQQTYQVVGDPDVRPRGEASAVEGDADAGGESGAESGFSEDDVEIVSMRTGASEEEAREALEETGDLAAAVQKLE